MNKKCLSSCIHDEPRYVFVSLDLDSEADGRVAIRNMGAGNMLHKKISELIIDHEMKRSVSFRDAQRLGFLMAFMNSETGEQA